MEELVLEKGAYEIDVNTWKASVPEDELRKAGYVKLADDETVVKKVVLSKEEVEFMECNKHLPFRSEAIDFLSSANTYVDEHAVTCEDDYMMLKRLVKAYFCGYTVRETKYYIKLQFGNNGFEYLNYLNINRDNGGFCIGSGEDKPHFKHQFTQKEIDELQKNPQARGLDLNALKVKISDAELAD